MTYSQLRRYLSDVAAWRNVSAPNKLFPVSRWRSLRRAGCVTQTTDGWLLTPLAWTILREPTMPKRRPKARPSHHARLRIA